MLRPLVATIIFSATLAGCYKAPEPRTNYPPAAPVSRPPPGCELEYDDEDEQWEIDCDDNRSYHGAGPAHKPGVAKAPLRARVIQKYSRVKEKAKRSFGRTSRSRR